MTTGKHNISRIYCVCSNEIGWKYNFAKSFSQKYKEGNFLLESALLKKAYWVS